MKLEQKFVKNLVGFLGDLRTPKFHSEIKWPLGGCKTMMDTGAVFSGEASVFREELSLSCFVAMCNNKSGQKNWLSKWGNWVSK